MASSSSSSPEMSSADPVQSFSYKDATKEEVLEDLSSRFILNLPDEELTSLERLCFQVEQAHWFYEDFIREQNTKLPSLPLKKFSEMLFRACPLLNKWSDSHELAFNNFMQYKTRVPVCGAIMLNAAMDKCVLVKGWKASSGWGFPKGKINQTEPEVDCAIREVLEETGYNLADQVDPEHVLSIAIKEQKISLYIVPGVPEDFPFETKTRKEISKIQWFHLADLPTWKRNKFTPGRFYLISPFISGLKGFITQHKPRNAARKNGKQKKSQWNASLLAPIPQDVEYQKPVEHSDQQVYSANGTSQPSSSSRDDSSPSTNFPGAVLDAHMSRLLSSLTMSATTVATNTPQNLSGDAIDETPRVQSSSPRPSTISADSPSVVHAAAEQLDWSSSVPSNFNTQLSRPSNPDQNTYVETSSSLGATPSQEHPNGYVRTGEPDPSKTTYSKTTASSSTISASAFSSSVTVPPTISPPTGQSLASPTSPTSRRSSATADISPYLSRATAIPTSAKRLQQLSLLESVASESEQLAPIIAARAAMVSRGPGGVQYPPPPPVQPPMGPGNLRDVGILYSSMYPPPSASAAGFHPRPPLEQLVPGGYHDPFQVRARTSQAFHRSPMHNPTGSVNINQNQLLATINSSRGGPHQGPVPQMNPQLIHEQLQSQQFNGPPQFYPPQVNRQYAPQPFMNGLNAFPSTIMPPQSPQPFGYRTYPNAHPGFNPNPNPILNMGTSNAQNPTSLSLLSILNGRPSQQTKVPSQFVHQ